MTPLLYADVNFQLHASLADFKKEKTVVAALDNAQFTFPVDRFALLDVSYTVT